MSPMTYGPRRYQSGWPTCRDYTRGQDEANQAYREAREQQTGMRIRRGEDESACEICWSDVADYIADCCGKLVCTSCGSLWHGGVVRCVKHQPVEEEMEEGAAAA